LPSTKVGFHWTEDTLSIGLKEFTPKLEHRIGLLVDYYAPRTQSYARSNAPWKDRTGNARNGLFADATHGHDLHEIVLRHSVPYGIWLEVRFEGKYAIIVPTIKHMFPELMKSMNGLIARMR